MREFPPAACAAAAAGPDSVDLAAAGSATTAASARDTAVRAKPAASTATALSCTAHAPRAPPPSARAALVVPSCVRAGVARRLLSSPESENVSATAT